MKIGKREITFGAFILELFTLFISTETKLLGEDIVNNHLAWTQKRYCITNGGKEIWTANRVFSIDFSPNISAFNIFEKIYLKSCIKKSNILTALKASEFKFKNKR